VKDRQTINLRKCTIESLGKQYSLLSGLIPLLAEQPQVKAKIFLPFWKFRKRPQT